MNVDLFNKLTDVETLLKSVYADASQDIELRLAAHDTFVEILRMKIVLLSAQIGDHHEIQVS